MALSEDSTLVSFDAEAALAAGREATESGLLTCLEYTHQDFHTLYVDDQVAAQYDDVAHMERHFDAILSYSYIDFSERELFEQDLPAAGRVQYFMTRMRELYVVRLLLDAEGLFVTFAPDAPVSVAVDAMRDVMVDTDTRADSPYET